MAWGGLPTDLSGYLFCALCILLCHMKLRQTLLRSAILKGLGNAAQSRQWWWGFLHTSTPAVAPATYRAKDNTERDCSRNSTMTTLTWSYFSSEVCDEPSLFVTSRVKCKHGWKASLSDLRCFNGTLPARSICIRQSSPTSTGPWHQFHPEKGQWGLFIYSYDIKWHVCNRKNFQKGSRHFSMLVF